MGNNTTTRISSQATTYNEFKIYPNPTSGLINVSLIGSSSIKSIRIYDLPGKEIFCRTYAVSEGSNNENIDLKGLENGMFIIKIIDNEDRIITSRIIKIADE